MSLQQMFVEHLLCSRLYALDWVLHVHCKVEHCKVSPSWSLEFMVRVEQGFSASALLTLWAM